MATGRIGANDLTAGAKRNCLHRPADTYAVASLNCVTGEPATCN